jgi:hypothetical protein
MAISVTLAIEWRMQQGFVWSIQTHLYEQQGKISHVFYGLGISAPMPKRLAVLHWLAAFQFVASNMSALVS